MLTVRSNFMACVCVCVYSQEGSHMAASFPHTQAGLVGLPLAAGSSAGDHGLLAPG